MSAFSDAVNRRQRDRERSTNSRETAQRSFSSAVNNKRNELANRKPERQQRVNPTGYTAAQEWSNNVNNVLQQYGDFASNWSNNDLAYRSYRRQLEELYNQADQIRGGVSGDYAAEDSVSYAQLALRRAIEGIAPTQAFYSQFGSQDEYDAASQYTNDLANLDLDAAWEDLERQKRERDEYASSVENGEVGGLVNVANGTAPAMQPVTMDEFGNMSYSDMLNHLNQYGRSQGDVSAEQQEMDRRINERQQYLFGIQTARDLADLEAVTSAEDFAANSAYQNPVGTSEAARTYRYINDPEYRERHDSARSGRYGRSAANALTPEEYESIDQMSEPEIAVFNYYFNTQGEEAAMDYLDKLTPTIRQRRAAERFDELEGRTGAELAFGVAAGLDQFGSGISSLFNTKDDYIAPSWRQYASGMVREDLQEARLLRNSNAENSAGQVAYDSIVSGANMLPSILVSAAVGALNPIAGQATGAALMGASASGNAYQEMLNLGYSKAQARGYSALVGASEAGLSYLLGGISKLGGAIPGGVTEAILRNVDNAFARVAIQLGMNAVSEFGEEYLQEILTPWFQNIALNAGNDVELITPEALYSGLLGALTAGLMEGGGTVGGAVQTRNTGRDFLGSTATIDDLKALAALMPDNADVQDLAARVNENSNAYTVGRFYEAVESGMPAQFKADLEATRTQVVDSLLAAGVTQKDAGIIAGAVTGQMLGRKLTASQNRLLAKLSDTIPGLNRIISESMKSNEMARAAIRGEVNNIVRGKANIKKSAETATATQQQTPPASHEMTRNGSQGDRRGTYSTVESLADEYDVTPSAIARIAQESTTQIDEKAFTESMRSVLAFTQETTLSREEAIASLQKNVTTLNAQQISAAVDFGWDLRNAVSAEKQRAYDMGFAGQDIGDVLDSKLLSHLTEAQRREAFNEGAKVAKEAVASGEKALPKTASVAYRKGSVRFDGDAKAISSKFKMTQRSAYIILERIAQLTGMDIVLFASKTDAYGNFIEEQGKFNSANPNEIRIDVNAGLNNVNDMGSLANYVMLRTFTHEFVHSIEVNAPAQYRALKEAVFAEIRRNGKENVENLILIEQEKGGKNEDGSYNLSYDDASHEVLAQSLVDVLPQSTFIETLATQHRNIFEKLYAALKRFMRTIRHRFEQMTSVIPSEAAALKRDVDGAMQYAQHIVDLFDKAALAAVETVQNKGAEAAQTKEVTDQQANENPTGKVRYNLRNTKNMQWDKQVRGVLKNLNTIKRNDTLYVGKTPAYLVAEGVSQKPLAMPIRVFTKSHSGKDFTHSIKEENLYKLGHGIGESPVVINDPSRNSIVFITNIFQDGHPIVVAFKKDSLFDGDNVHEATTVHLRTNVEAYLEGLTDTATVYVKNKKEPFVSVGVTNNLRSLAANIRFMDEIIAPMRQSVNPSRSQRRENLTDRAVLERVDEIVGAVSDRGTVTGDTHGLDVDEVAAFKGKLSEGERSLLNIYADRLAKLNDLQEQRREQGRLYRRFMADPNPNNRDRGEAAATKNRMDILDQQIDRAMNSLREVERAKAYKSLLTKSRELVQQTERGRILTALQLSREKRERSGQRRQRKDSIIRSAEELENLLNKGNKKRNVKKDMQGLAAGAADLYNVLFNEEMNFPKNSKQYNEQIVRNGFGVILSTREAAHAEEARNILSKMERGRTQELENQLAYRMGQLHDALERERERINSIKAGDVFQRIADEYKSLQNSGYDYIRGAFSEDAYNHLLQLKDKVGTTAARDMTLAQLIDLDNAYRMVLTTIRNANKLFIDGQKQTVQQAGNRVIIEVGRKARANKLMTDPGKLVSTFTWNNEKPIYAFERIGSDTLTDLFWNIRHGEDVWIVDVDEARAYRQAQAKKYGYDSWDTKKRYEFKSTDGATFSLTLEQLMSLYAYSKREQAIDHLLKGGVVLAGADVIVNGKRLVNDDATAYAIPADTLAKIGESLTADQRGYVDAMQDYLSRDMARKGNEVSNQLYGIDLFGEKNYFPINSSGIYNEKAEQQFRQKENGQISIVNSGFTKSTAPKASNPVRLSGFSDVWASHVNEMSMYHAFVLPLEDFRRVRNFQTTTENGTKGEGVVAAIQNAQGSAAVKYINQLMEDLNGGAVSDYREAGFKQMTSKFKKAATMASLSVVVQQISSLPRAWTVIDPKYFSGKVNKQKYSSTLAELREYAPVMRIKEMGHFDTGMGRSATEYINAREYTGKERLGAFFKDSGYRDDILGKLPAKVDEIAWVSIWEACKKELHAKYPKMNVTSEDFLRAAGERFTEVIVKTQVYDSTLTKSANMRSKSALMGMVTSFLAEPTVTANMFFNALRSKDSKVIGRTAGALLVSSIANNFLASLVYAMRDDDEDETYWEKYLQSFTTGMLDSLNPLTWLPLLRDVWSILQGFDVQRADMNLISSVVDSLKSFVRTAASWSDDMTDEEKKAYWKEFGMSSLNIALTVANMFGIPLKNVAREVSAVYNTFEMANDDVHGNARKMGEKIWDDVRTSTPILGWFPKANSKTDRLYDAIVSGDTGYQERAQLTYASEKSYENAVRKALRENDIRIEAAAKARMSGNLTEYVRLFREIENEGHFEFDTIMAAVNAAENALTPDEESEASESTHTLFTVGNYYTALAAGDETSAQLAYEELYQQKLAEGYLADEARSSVENSLATQIGQAYRDDEISREKALELLTDNTEYHGEYDIAKWDFQMKYGFTWGSREREYRIGSISRDALIQEYMSIEGKTRAEAIEYVNELDFENREGYDYSEIGDEYAAGNINRQQAASRFIEAGFTSEEAEEKLVVIDFEREFPGTEGISYKAANNYRTYCEPVGIGGKAFFDSWKIFNETETSRDENGDAIEGQGKKDKVLAYIDSLPYSAAQKDSLYLAFGYSEKNIDDAPWH